MVFILNYLPWIVLATGFAILYKLFRKPNDKTRNNRIFLVTVITIITLITLQGLTAGYIPKARSSEAKIPAPAFEQTEAVVQDRLLSPKRLGDESEARIAEKTDWRKHKREQAAQTEAPQATPPQ